MPDESSKSIGQMSDAGTTCRRSRRQATGTPTLSAADSLAKTSVLRGKAKESGAHALDCGVNLHGSFAFFDLDSSSWKTHQGCLFEGLIEFSATWPRSGM